MKQTRQGARKNELFVYQGDRTSRPTTTKNINGKNGIRGLIIPLGELIANERRSRALVIIELARSAIIERAGFGGRISSLPTLFMISHFNALARIVILLQISTRDPNSYSNSTTIRIKIDRPGGIFGSRRRSARGSKERTRLVLSSRSHSTQ